MKRQTDFSAQRRAGAAIAELLELKPCPEHPDRWQTTWGTKTDLGLYLTVKRYIDEALAEDPDEVKEMRE
tara:strand:+ start:856 stop:1065 length:210 start_codon:yes stop_codon:yes gene_type:complete